MGIVYAGMPKEDLPKAGYTEYLQVGYKKFKNKEWITYRDWITPKRGDTVTFYLEDGIVRGWKVNKGGDRK